MVFGDHKIFDLGFWGFYMFVLFVFVFFSCY